MLKILLWVFMRINVHSSVLNGLHDQINIFTFSPILTFIHLTSFTSVTPSYLAPSRIVWFYIFSLFTYGILSPWTALLLFFTLRHWCKASPLLTTLLWPPEPSQRSLVLAQSRTLDSSEHLFFIFPFFFLFFFNWSIVALHSCVSFCCTAKWISHTCTYISSFFGFPSHLGHHRAPSGVPCAIQSVLLSYLFYIVVYICQSQSPTFFILIVDCIFTLVPDHKLFENTDHIWFHNYITQHSVWHIIGAQ